MLCRNIKDEEVAEWGKRYQEFNSVLSCIVEMHTDAGIVGYGEAECPNGLSEAFRFACENLIGADPLDIQHNMREVCSVAAIMQELTRFIKDCR